MPEPVTNELLYEVLKSVQAQIAVLREDMGGVKTRLSTLHSSFAALQSSVAAFHVDLAEMSARLDRLESRFERVETRLGLHDPQH